MTAEVDVTSPTIGPTAARTPETVPLIHLGSIHTAEESDA